jgi:hypothetical protein
MRLIVDQASQELTMEVLKLLEGRCLQRPEVFGHFRRGTNVKPEVDAWIAAQRLNRLAQVL